MNKIIVITGSTRGIGYETAKEFLRQGHHVVLSGRNQADLDARVNELVKEFGDAVVFAHPCDVSSKDQVDSLWKAAVERFGRVDIWINNAGASHDQVFAWEVLADNAESIIKGNILGTIYGCQTAMKGMVAQGEGAIYNFSGFGSNGRTRFGTSIYGTTKAATTYFTKALAAEAKDTGIIIGDLQPGMVLTDLVLGKIPADQLKRVKKIFNIIAELPETIAPWIVRNILKNTKNGSRFIYLPQWKLTLRFLTAPFIKRDLFERNEISNE